MPKKKKEIRFTIRQARNYAGLNIRDAAKGIRVSYPTLSRWENGVGHPYYESVQRMSELYGVPIELIDVGGEENDPE